MGLRDDAVGLAFRAELATDLLRAPAVVDFVEVIAETCHVGPAAFREARALTALWPVLPHGVKLSLGSASGIDDDKARKLGELARHLDAPFVSEHASFTSAGDVEIGHLTQLPRTRAAVDVLARNVERARRHLPVPLLLENVAWTWLWPDDDRSEADFYCDVVEATGCDLLLDLGNLRANALNEGRDPEETLRALPLGHVKMVHIAGGVVDDGFFYDNHAAAVPDGVFDLLRLLVRLRGPVPVLLERDGHYPAFAALAAELERARSCLRAGVDDGALAPSPSSPVRAPLRAPVRAPLRAPVRAPLRSPPPARAEEGLAAQQAELAERLTAATWAEATTSPSLLDARHHATLSRARSVLSRKRIDDALPLLPRLAARGETVVDVAARALVDVPRLRRGAAPADARVIALAAADDDRFGDDARLDLLMLRARFTGPDRHGGLRPRRGPFVGAVRLPAGGRVVVLKGPGAGANLHLARAAR